MEKSTDGGIILFMNYNLLKSRTFWSTVALFIVSGTNGIMGLIPAGDVIYVQFFLSALIGYFHLQTAKAGNVSN